MEAIKKGNPQVISDIQRITGRNGDLPENHRALTGELFQYVFPEYSYHTSNPLPVVQSTWEWPRNHQRKHKGGLSSYLTQSVNP